MLKPIHCRALYVRSTLFKSRFWYVQAKILISATYPRFTSSTPSTTPSNQPCLISSLQDYASLHLPLKKGDHAAQSFRELVFFFLHKPGEIEFAFLGGKSFIFIRVRNKGCGKRLQYFSLFLSHRHSCGTVTQSLKTIPINVITNSLNQQTKPSTREKSE